MRKLLQTILSSSRKRRSLAVGAALWLLRLVHVAEEDELNRYSDKLEGFCLSPDSVSRRAYCAVEDRCIDCEFALGFLVSAIEDLGYAYEERF